MLQLSYRGNRHLVVDEVAPPVPGPGEVRVRVHSVGLCKSDVYGYAQVNDRRDAVLGEGEVLVMGHEASGYVDAVGPSGAGGVGSDAAEADTSRLVADTLAVGTPVAVNPIVGCGTCARCVAGAENLCEQRTVHGCIPSAPGAFAEALVVPRRNVFPLRDGAPVEWGALVEPFAVGFHGVRLGDPRPGQSVLVIGGGVIGIGAALAAQRRVGDGVLVLEPQPGRRRLIESLGLAAAPPEQVLGSGREFDLALDCVARPETFEGAIGAVPPQGLVVLVGIWEDTIPLPVSTVVWRETRIAGSYGYSHADFADVTDWVGRCEVDLAPIIERRVGFDDVISAFEAYADGSLDAVRTLFQPGIERPEGQQ